MCQDLNTWRVSSHELVTCQETEQAPLSKPLTGTVLATLVAMSQDTLTILLFQSKM